MTGRDGSNEVRVDDPALQQVQRPGVEVVPQSLIDEVPSGIAQPGRPENGFTRDPLVAEVVYGEAHALIPHPGRLVDLAQQHGTSAVCQSWQWMISGRLPALNTNSSAALLKNANRSTSSQAPYRCPRLKKLSSECGSMKKHLRPSTKPNHTVQLIAPLYHGTYRSSCAPVAQAGGLGDVVFGLSRELEVRALARDHHHVHGDAPAWRVSALTHALIPSREAAGREQDSFDRTIIFVYIAPTSRPVPAPGPYARGPTSKVAQRTQNARAHRL